MDTEKTNINNEENINSQTKANIKANITIEDFVNVDLRLGTIVQAEKFEKARKPAYKIWVDFGSELGVLKTSAQITNHYDIDSLIDKRVIGCVNLGRKQIADFMTDFLLVGFAASDGGIILATLDDKACEVHVKNGEKLH